MQDIISSMQIAFVGGVAVIALLGLFIYGSYSGVGSSL